MHLILKLVSLLCLTCTLPHSILSAGSIDTVKNHIRNFQESYFHRENLTPEEFVDRLNEQQYGLTIDLKIDKPVRQINVELLTKFISELSDSNVHILIRHGEQEIAPWVRELPKAEQKIAMMRREENLRNPLTDASLAEAFCVVLAIDYASLISGIRWEVDTSRNLRASQFAELLAYGLSTNLLYKSQLDCVNYPEDDIIPTHELLKWLPDGTLPWEKELVDLIIGKGSYARIQSDVNDLISEKSNTISVTHTQQISAGLEQSNLKVERLENYGFLLFSKSASLYERGLF